MPDNKPTSFRDWVNHHAAELVVSLHGECPTPSQAVCVLLAATATIIELQDKHQNADSLMRLPLNQAISMFIRVAQEHWDRSQIVN